MTIDEFLEQNESFRAILELPRVAEIVDMARKAERETWEIRQHETELLTVVEQYRAEAANPVNWALLVYKKLIEEAERKLNNADRIIEQTVSIRTATLSQRLAVCQAKLHNQGGK